MSIDNADNARDPLLWLRGDRVALGPFTRDLVEDYWRWEQDPQVIIGYGRQTPESLEARIAGYESQARSMADQIRFTVYDLTTGGEPRPVGTTALRIDHYVRIAEYVILLGAEGRGRRLAREATLLTLDYGFHITNLRAVWLKVLEHNIAGIRAYQGAGFKPAGQLRRCGYWLGAECDEIMMDALRGDFPGPSAVCRQATGTDQARC
ncbi:MAG: GNAT family N-acetyltransferase [Pseudonocardiaceae bacterium]